MRDVRAHQILEGTNELMRLTSVGSCWGTDRGRAPNGLDRSDRASRTRISTGYPASSCSAHGRLRMSSDVLFERRGAAGLITLNRPQALNAVTHATVHAMAERLAARE